SAVASSAILIVLRRTRRPGRVVVPIALAQPGNRGREAVDERRQLRQAPPLGIGLRPFAPRCYWTVVASLAHVVSTSRSPDRQRDAVTQRKECGQEPRFCGEPTILGTNRLG